LSKYKAKRTLYRGVFYASKAEALRANQLDLIVRAGKEPRMGGQTPAVLFWVPQPKFRLGCPENVYVADFLVIGPDRAWAEDVKGHETPTFKKNVRLWRVYGPCELHVICKKASDSYVVEGGIPAAVRREAD